MTRSFMAILSSFIALFLICEKTYSQSSSYNYNSSRYREKTSSQEKLRGYYGLPYQDKEAVRWQEVFGAKSKKMLKKQHKKY